jgi:hypothetical protein
MAKRLHMTSADYLAIAISPALIMALVGSLVFFLLEVLYVGDYEARLTYVFALFVFAAVLVSRISIEDGREYASLFALPLGLATFLVLVKFVEHPGPWSHLINLAMMLLVWWCADKLTWDCTLIDDNEDASGEGLLQRAGVDDSAATETQPFGAASNELFESPTEPKADVPWWRRLRTKKRGHAPGLWVLYFSLAALPLYGIGQHWIPATDVGRRQYVFVLLLVYVASALALLVTTSFLGLRRYLRQRRVEMPNPMAATWVAVGAVLIVIVMFLAALIPRPNAEYAISKVPWQAHSPAGLSSSRNAVGSDAPKDQEDQTEPGHVVDEKGPQGDAQKPGQPGEQSKSAERQASDSREGKSDGKSNQQQPSSDPKVSGGEKQSKSQQEPSQSSQKLAEKSDDGKTEGGESTSANGKSPDESKKSDQTEAAVSNNGSAQETEQTSQSSRPILPQHSRAPREIPKLPDLTRAVGGLAGILKLLFYVAAAVVVIVLIWRYRRELAAAIADILRQLRELLARLFGGKPLSTAAGEEESATVRRRERSFAEFRNPFVTGDYRRLPPEELVRYTFDAFEAWARDGGYPRSADQTPTELVRAAAAPGTAVHDEARRMLRLYSDVAYGSAAIEAPAAHSLRGFWALLSSTTPSIPE